MIDLTQPSIALPASVLHAALSPSIHRSLPLCYHYLQGQHPMEPTIPSSCRHVYPILLPTLYLSCPSLSRLYMCCVCLSVSKFVVCISPLRVLVLDRPYRVLSCTSRFVFFLSPLSTSLLYFCPPPRHTLLVRPLYNLGTVLRRFNISFHYSPSPRPSLVG